MDMLNTLDVNPINQIKMHLKQETLVKDDVINMWEQQKPRNVLWFRYGYSALMAPVFNEMKKRLKEVLHQKILYVDGLTPI